MMVWNGKSENRQQEEKKNIFFSSEFEGVCVFVFVDRVGFMVRNYACLNDLLFFFFV